MTPPQSYANHKKYVFMYHRVAFALILVLLIWAIRLLIKEPSLDSVIALITVVVLGFLFWYARIFPLGVQNRVIRLEEELRYGRILPDDLRARAGELSLGQVIALRFASDEELPGLMRQVLGGQLTTQDAIKRAIKVWRPDHYRI
ncbi:MAG: hypothetical protein FJ206_05795 [Gemmatimonadetes bacterium]|nr:hypothetical protein [Gemmatimonadota bacterium]